ncbi:MAG: hypothetical protein HY514_00900 [Candidatus Aenigmarchaeota archaeon]|nr:hypothetical protein [Candidatus Aenigmarchaeota archaeon]
MFPAEHTGATQKRKWYKVRWNEKANPNLIGKIDLLSEDIYEKQKNYVHVIETVETEQCAGGTPLGFGKWHEKKIEEWIKENRK